MTRPDFSQIPPFYQGYVRQVETLDMLDALRQSSAETIHMVRAITEDRGEFRYAPEKWSIKELQVHMMDAERIFAYRALRFARHDSTPLAGFEENDYVPQSNAHARTIERLADEMHRLRLCTLDLFESFTPEMLARTGSANNSVLSVLHLGYIIAGHESHHRNILRERYLKG